MEITQLWDRLDGEEKQVITSLAKVGKKTSTTGNECFLMVYEMCYSLFACSDVIGYRDVYDCIVFWLEKMKRVYCHLSS